MPNKPFTMTCESGKRRYENMLQAEEAINAAWTNKMRGYQRSASLPCRYYLCHLCNGWHLTSQPKRHP